MRPQSKALRAFETKRGTAMSGTEPSCSARAPVTVSSDNGFTFVHPAAFPMRLTLRFAPVVRSAAFGLLLSVGFAVRAEEAGPFLTQIRSHFEAWDADRDGVLELTEIDMVVVSAEVKGEAAATAVALRRAARSKTNPLPPLTLEKIGELATTGVKADEHGHGEVKPTNFKSLYEAALQRINTTKRELFVSGQPSLNGFRQGRLGTCYCLAPLSALLYRDGGQVGHIFESQPDGFVKVTFGDKRTVMVAPLTDAELALASGTGNDGVWAAVYEKAVGHLRGKLAANTPDAPFGPLMNAGRGGPTGEYLSVLTGHEVKSFSCKAWKASPAKEEAVLEAELEKLRHMILENLRQNRLMGASSPTDAPKVPSLSGNHAYAVISLDPENDLVTFRDPHGQTFRPKGEPGLTNGYEVKNGFFQAPLADMVKFMGSFVFEQAAPRKGPAVRKVGMPLMVKRL
jgi:hypothetical protein